MSIVNKLPHAKIITDNGMEIIKPLFKGRIFNVVPEPIALTNRKKYQAKRIEVKDEVDLRDTDSPVDDQGFLGSCSANAIVNTYENMVLRNQPANFTNLSRLFLYYNTRVLEDVIAEDHGVLYLSNAFESLKVQGICNEAIWEYDTSQFAVGPSALSYQDALSRKILSYEYIEDIAGVKEVLSSGKPVVIGMSVFSNFMLADNTDFIVPKPTENDYILGGHAVSIVGYTKDNHFIIKNSYGPDWGDNGYALLSPDYMEEYVFDRWYFTLDNENDLL